MTAVGEYSNDYPVRGADREADKRFTVMVGRDSDGKWVGTCSEVDVMTVMSSRRDMAEMIRILLCLHLRVPVKLMLNLDVVFVDIVGY